MELLDKDGLSPAVRIWSVALLVAMVTFIIYLPALDNGFVNWDDDEYVYENPYIRSLDFKFLMWSFTSFYASNWHPLTWLSHGVDYALWGLNPRGHHLSSVILHSFNTFLLFILAAYLLLAAPSFRDVIVRKSRPSSGLAKQTHSSVLNDKTVDNTVNKALFIMAIIAAGVTGLLFGIHPVHVESVAWVSERKDVLSTFFVLLSVISYVKYVIGKQQAAVVIEFHFPKGGNRGVKLYYILSLIFFILALMSKPMAVTLPAVLVILDIYPFERLSSGGSVKGWIKAYREVLIEKVPFFFFSLVSVVLTLMAQQAGGAIKSLETYSLSVRIGLAIKGLIFYLWKMVLPVGLSPFYPHPKSISFLSVEYLISVLLVIAVSGFCVWAWKRGKKTYMVAWMYYVVTLLPVLGIIQVGNQAAADRYTYIPSIGPFLTIGIGISLLIKKTHIKRDSFSLTKTFIIFTSGLIILFLSMLAIKQIKVWKDPVTLWSHEIKRYPEVSVAYNNRGNAYIKLRNYQNALEDLDKAIKLNPGHAQSYYNRAIVFIGLGDHNKALNDLDKAIELRSETIAEAYSNRCGVYEKLGNYVQAIKDCSRAIEIDPKNLMAHNNRGIIYAKLGEYQKAIMDFSQAILINPEDYVLYRNRGIVYSKNGRNEEAIKNFKIAASMGDRMAQELLKKNNINGR